MEAVASKRSCIDISIVLVVRIIWNTIDPQCCILLIWISRIYVRSRHKSQFHGISGDQGIIRLVLNCYTVHKNLDWSWSSNHCVNMHCSVIFKQRFYPCCYGLRNSCHTRFLGYIEGCSNCGGQHVWFGVFISVNEKDVDFLPWCAEVRS